MELMGVAIGGRGAVEKTNGWYSKNIQFQPPRNTLIPIFHKTGAEWYRKNKLYHLNLKHRPYIFYALRFEA